MSQRKIPFTVLKFVIAAAIFGWIFHKIDASKVWENVSHAKIHLVVSGIFVCWLTVLLAGWRWHRLLAVFEIPVPFLTLVGIAQVGQFFLMFLPGPAGDDLTRMLYVSRFAKNRMGEACTTVLMDRCIGLSSILLLAFICIPFQWTLLSQSAQTQWMALGMASGGAVIAAGLLIFLAIKPTLLQRLLHWIIQWVPSEKFRAELRRMSELLCFNKKAVLSVVLIAVGTQLLVCALYWLAGASVGIQLSPLLWLSFLPIVLAANAVPITVAGAGVREYLMVLFLGALAGIGGTEALAASLLAFAMMLAVSLLGGIVYVFFRPAKHTVP